MRETLRLSASFINLSLQQTEHSRHPDVFSGCWLKHGVSNKRCCD
ncbi:hypothetical protein [Vagococcus acidifermentans]|nr:hypothetical protein [Vagococcus acidifermentans]